MVFDQAFSVFPSSQNRFGKFDDASEEARAHLRPKVYVPWKESDDHPPVRGHVGNKDRVWKDTVDKLVRTIGTTQKQQVNSIYRMEDDRNLAPSQY